MHLLFDNKSATLLLSSVFPMRNGRRALRVNTSWIACKTLLVNRKIVLIPKQEIANYMSRELQLRIRVAFPPDAPG